MTPDDEAIGLAHRVQHWQSLLAPLGVGHWHIDRVSVVDEPFGSDAKAAIWRAENYDRCTFEFSHDIVGGDERELDRCIIHEWLHAAFRDHDHAVDGVEDLLAPQTWDVMSERITHEREGLVDRLAFLIEALYHDD